MAGWNASSTFLKIALICLSLGLVLFVIGFATNSWVKGLTYYGTVHSFGLWKYFSCPRRAYCSSQKVTTNYLIAMGIEDWFRATQAMECLGLLCMGIALLILFLYFFVSQCKRRKAMIAIILFTFASVIFIVIGVAVFATKFEDRGYDISWSMGLAIAGAVLAFVAGVMEVIELR